MYFPLEEAKNIARRYRLVAEYVPGVGARCILCGAWGRALHNGIKKLKNGVIRRYFTCDSCGLDKYKADFTSKVTDEKP